MLNFSIVLLLFSIVSLPAHSFDERWRQVGRNSLWYGYARYVPCPIKHKVNPVINAARITAPLRTSRRVSANLLTPVNGSYNNNPFVYNEIPSNPEPIIINNY